MFFIDKIRYSLKNYMSGIFLHQSLLISMLDDLEEGDGLKKYMNHLQVKINNALRIVLKVKRIDRVNSEELHTI